MQENVASSASFYEAVLRQAVIQDCMRELDSLPSEEELAKTISYSPRHIARMKKLFADEARRVSARRFFSVAKKAVAAAVIVLGVLFGLLMLNPNIRAVVVDTVVEWFETFTRFQSPQTEKSEFDTSWRPSYVPEGFVEADVFEDVEGEMVTIFYRSESESLFLVYAPADSPMAVNNEGVEYGEIEIDKVIYFYFESVTEYADNQIVWENAGIRFAVMSTISIDELFLVARSIS